MKKNLLFLSLLIAAISCTKERGVSGPAGAPGAAGTDGKGSATDTGTIAGRLFLFDEFSFPQSSTAGVTVTLSSGSQQHNLTTDASGQYHFSGITTGTYDLSFQKPGYGTMKVFGIAHFGGGAAPTGVEDVSLLQMPVKTAPDTLMITANFSYVNFVIRLDTSSQQYVQFHENMLLFISKNKTVGLNDYYIEQTAYFTPESGGGYVGGFLKYDLKGRGTTLRSGDTLYAVAYTFNRYIHHVSGNPNAAYYDPGPGSYFVDPQTGEYVYPNLSKPTNIVKFVF